MKQALAIAAVATVAFLAAVAPASAASGKAPTLRSLQAQITALQKQVKKLKKTATEADQLAAVGLTFSACSTAVTADTFQDTFTSLDGYFTTHSLPAYFGAQTPVDDYGACQALSIVRTHNQHPATTAVLKALMDLFRPTSSAAAHESFMDLARQRGYFFGQLFVLRR